MALNDNARLRQLVGDYYHGLISLDSYRQQRAELLDNIGAQVDEQSDTRTNKKKNSVAEAASAAKPAPASSGVPGSASGSRKSGIIAASIAGIVIVGLVVATQLFEIDTAPELDAKQEGAVPESGIARGDALIEEFLSRNDWSPDGLSNFRLAWGAMDDGQRRLATKGRSYRELTTRLHQRIREEIALGAAAGSDRLGSLEGFAETLGVPYRGSLPPVANRMTQEDASARVEPQEKPVVPEIVSAEEAAEPTEGITSEADPPVSETPPTDTAEQAIDEADPPIEVPASDPNPESLESANPAVAVDDPCTPEIAKTRRPYCQDMLSSGSKGPPLVVLPAGSFQMGNDGVDTESPAHPVEIAKNIAMSRFEITADEFAEYCAATGLSCPDSAWSGDHPVVSVSWDDAVEYTDWLSETTGFRYRLPSEAEWEFAARAGTQSPYAFGDSITPSAAFSSENGVAEAPLPRTDRSINRNPFRLYHMSGNVREWTMDAWYPDYENARLDGSARSHETEALRVVRGGSFTDPGHKLRSAAREPLDRSHRDTVTGFRVVREVSAATP
jgi:formylglycine-generating enzyme required for sulfatase activity